MDALESELRGLLQDTFNRNKLLLLLKEMSTDTEKRESRHHTHRVPAPPCTIYTSIKRNYTCHHCGAKFSSIVNLKKDESVPSLDTKGSTQIITSKSPVEVECSTYICNNCESFVSGMSREVLETRYMSLLRRFPLHFHHIYIQSLNEGDKPSEIENEKEVIRI